MSVGPEAGAFYGVPYQPSSPAQAAGVDGSGSFVAPLVVVIDAVTTGVIGVAGGLLAAQLPASGATGRGRFVRRVTVAGTALPDGTRADLYVGVPNDRRSLVDGTTTGDLDVSEYPAPGLYVPGGTALTVVWSATTGTAFARFEFQDL